MSNLNNGETQTRILTNACNDICAFIKTITVDNVSKDEQINMFETKIDDLHCHGSELQQELIKIDEHVKTLAGKFNFTFNQDESTIDLLTRWNSSLIPTKKRKLYSPLKLSLNDIREDTITPKKKIRSKRIEKEKKYLWKLQSKRKRNPIEVIKKPKQRPPTPKHREKKSEIDTTSKRSATPKETDLNLTTEALNMVSNNVPENICENNLINENQMTDRSTTTCNSDISKEIVLQTPNILNPQILIIEDNSDDLTQFDVDEPIDENITPNELVNEIIISQKQTLKYEGLIEKHGQESNKHALKSNEVIPSLKTSLNNRAALKFKIDPEGIQAPRRITDSWDCAKCRGTKKMDVDQEELRNTMYYYSRHSSDRRLIERLSLTNLKKPTK